MTRDHALYGLRLGALVGLAEAIAIVRYDLVMADPRIDRVVLAMLWGLLIVIVDAAIFALVSALVRGRAWAVAAIYLVPLVAVRAITADRFEWTSLGAVALAFALAPVGKRFPRLLGLAAFCMAVPGLWGRVPIYATPWDQQVLFHLPGLATVGVLGALDLVPMLGLGGVLVAATLVASFLHGRGSATPADATARKPNVLFILVDTLRKDHVYGPKAPASIQKLANDGVVFDDAITVIPKTTPSVASFQTGRLPIHSGVRILKDDLAQSATTLAEILRGEGYRTGAIVHNGWILRGRGFEQGFERFESYFEIERPYGPLRLTGWLTVLDALTLRRSHGFDGQTDAYVATDRALSWLEENGDDPFFLYVHYFDPHWPYRPPGADGECVVNNITESRWSRGKLIFDNPLPKKENDRAVELYGGEVRHNTDEIGRILDWLEASGKADDTLVIFTADHGHHLGDHDYWYHHGEFLYEPGIGIPLVLRLPGAFEGGRHEPIQFRNVDLLPTVLTAVGVPVPEDIDGLPLATLQRDGAPPAFLETDLSYFVLNKRREVPGQAGKVRGARLGRWKLHYTPRKSGSGLWELYDLETDPVEAHDLVKEGSAPPDVLAALVAVVVDGIPEDERAILRELGDPLTGPGAASTATAKPDAALSRETEEALDANDVKMLRALGYVE